MRLLLILVMATAARLFACSCVPGITTCGSLKSAEVAFVGTVISGSEAEGHDSHGFGDHPARLKVETIVRGLDPDTADVNVDPAVHTSCYLRLRVGERWLILGKVFGNRVMTGGCSGSTLIPASDKALGPIIIMHPEQGIRGTVKDSDGKPVAGIRVAAYAIEQGRPQRVSVRSAFTDREGNYEFQRLDNGTYIVGVNADWGEDSSPYRRTYHVASNSAEGATPVLLNGRTLYNIDISVGPARKLVPMSIRVTFADGKNAANALISVVRDDNGYLPGDLRDPSARFTDTTGVLKIRMYEGDEYLLSAKWTDFASGFPLRTRTSLDSNQVRAIAREGTVVTLTLNDPGSRPVPQK
jgi:hypothetical protein